MKTLKLLTLLIIGFCVSLNAQSSTGTDLFIILEKEGDAIIQSINGKLFEAKPATYLYKGNKLILGTDSYVMLHYGLLTMQITEAGEYLLNDELFEDVLTDGGEFDPLFADFTSFSIEVLVDAIEFGEWDIDRSDKGDGWGKKQKKDPGAWGKKSKKDPGAWGKKSKKDPGAWGANSLQSLSGYGVVAPDGWGKKQKKDVGGWGKKSKKDVGGWGFDDMTIESKSPGGYYLPEINTISWIAQDSVKQYLFIISDTLENNLLYSEIATTNSIEFDFSTLENDKEYFWQVFSDGRKEISQPINFVVKKPELLETIYSECNSSSNYNNSGTILKGLMKLYLLEQNGFFNQALKKYRYLLLKEPNNDLVRINYSSFLLRLGQFEKARDIAKKL